MGMEFNACCLVAKDLQLEMPFALKAGNSTRKSVGIRAFDPMPRLRRSLMDPFGPQSPGAWEPRKVVYLGGFFKDATAVMMAKGWSELLPGPTWME